MDKIHRGNGALPIVITFLVLNMNTSKFRTHFFPSCNCWLWIICFLVKYPFENDKILIIRETNSNAYKNYLESLLLKIDTIGNYLSYGWGILSLTLSVICCLIGRHKWCRCWLSTLTMYFCTSVIGRGWEESVYLHLS